MNTAATYRHTQRAPLCLVMYGAAALTTATAVYLRQAPEVPYLLGAVTAVIVLLGASFHHLTVEDTGDRLLIGFGPVPLFRNSVKYADVVGVDVGRTTLVEGLGIHVSPRGGWVWNIWGRDCVVFRLRRSRLTVGTDDAANLAAFVRDRIAGGSDSGPA
jgi:hypothetical protein